MDNQILSALIAVVGTLLGVLLGGRLSRESSMKAVAASNKNAIDIMQRQEIAKASSSFRCAFTKEIRLLSIIHPNHSPEYQTTYNMLRTAYVRHQKAVIRFEPYLSDPCLTTFKTKWKEYCCYNEQSQQATFSGYKTGVSHNDELRVRNLAVSQIKALLKFADPLK